MNDATLHDERPLIIGFVADLMFGVQIERAAERLGYRVEWVEQADAFGPETPDVNWRQPAEHLEGRGAELIRQIVANHPALMIFDLNNQQVPWRRWIALLKSAPATRRIPVVCFGSHVEVDTMQAAKSAGANAVLSRSAFTRDLPALIGKYARHQDPQALAAACAERLSDLAVQGLEEFNRGEYFEAHETLEDAWNADDGPGRELYRAILQVAVAYLQIERRNYRGAVKMFLRMQQWLEPLPEVCRGVNVAQLRKDADAARQELLALGEERLDQFDRRLFRPVRYQTADMD